MLSMVHGLAFQLANNNNHLSKSETSVQHLTMILQMLEQAKSFTVALTCS